VRLLIYALGTNLDPHRLSAASEAIKRGLSNEQFHAEVFQRVLDNYRSKGLFQFLTSEDVAALSKIITALK
jgi:hypothetical protein